MISRLRFVASLFLLVFSLGPEFVCALRLPFLSKPSSQSERLSFTKRGYRRLDEQEEIARKKTGEVLSRHRERFFSKILQIRQENDTEDIDFTASLNAANLTHPLESQSIQQGSSLGHDHSIPANANIDLSHQNQNPLYIASVHQLRQKVLDENVEFQKLQLAPNATFNKKVVLPGNADNNNNTKPVLHHNVIQLMVDRFHSGYTPGNRAANDTARLALCMEGGGVRGAVSAGMASCLAILGLQDTFDVVYGSSAGSVIGAYMVSRQMVCMDVYVDILPAAKRTFVCQGRMLAALLLTAVDGLFWKQLLPERIAQYRPSWFACPTPGMNISFVLDGIMCEENGVRPLDLETFLENNEKQPLRVASSYVRDGKLLSKSFGTEDFCKGAENESHDIDDYARRKHQQSLFSCLKASMTVPGATGPPVHIDDGNETLPFFDAFCFEPIPYRSAVEEGATHCLVLCSRPEDFVPKNKPGAYEKAIAPIYFHSHGQAEVARFFKKGGQQYIYAEDLMTLEEARLSMHDTVRVPPSTVLYGVERDEDIDRLAKHRNEWKRAHLLPLRVPEGTPELATLEQDRRVVLEGVRGGFAAAFDVLAPAIGIQLEANLTGTDVAQLIFPDDVLDVSILEDRLHIQGQRIGDCTNHINAIDQFSFLLQGLKYTDPEASKQNPLVARNNKIEIDALAGAGRGTVSLEHLFQKLPGFRSGGLSYVAERMRSGFAITSQ